MLGIDNPFWGYRDVEVSELNEYVIYASEMGFITKTGG
jgi:hypothetical protein